jgi:oligosaccharide reducing-end xylanase
MRATAGLLALLLAAGCAPTTDAVGSNEPAVLTGVTGPTTPAPLHDLGLTDAAIKAKIDSVYQQLFFGDPGSQAIYFASGDQAYIWDVLHAQVRTEGQGLGMMIAVERGTDADRQVFDSLWRYAKAKLQVPPDGADPNAGYFNSYCDSADQMTNTACLDPYGLEQFATALVFAHDRWKDSPGTIDYQADALALFHLIALKTEDNGGVVSGVTNTFDAAAHLPYSFPDVSSAGQTRPSIVMPGYYAVWAQALGEPIYETDAEAGRALIDRAANASTGLTPIRSDFLGKPLSGWAVFDPETYRTQINVVIDQIWTGTSHVDWLNKLLGFFTSKGNYGTAYAVDGSVCTNPAHEPSLVVANAIAAGFSTAPDRTQYMAALWNMPVPIGQARYYTGLLQLLGLMILGGQFAVI